MTQLTINQLQRMYSANIYELKNSDPLQKTNTSDASTGPSDSQEVLPKDDNPLFMSAEQRAASFFGVQFLPQSAASASKPGDVVMDPNYWGTPTTAAFIDEMKVKYAAVKDKTTVGTGYSFSPPYLLTPEMQKADMGNAFVVQTGRQFQRAVNAMDSLQGQQDSKKCIQDMAAESSGPMDKTLLADCDTRIEEKRGELRKILNGIQGLADKYGTQAEISAFFTDYTGFVTGKPQSLEGLHGDLGLPLT